jgi:ATP-dependent exoDNAse (exonuclease V) beta subunit
MQLKQEQKSIVEIEAPILEPCEIPDLSKYSEAEKRELLRPTEEDLNILYVAATRAQKNLQLNFDLPMYLGR